jgi:uncharacterized protein (DUF1800 family)
MVRVSVLREDLWRFSTSTIFFVAIACFLFTAEILADSNDQKSVSREDRTPPVFLHTGRSPLPASTGLTSAPTATTVDPLVIEGGHVMRRIGFGPSKKELKVYKKKGFAAYIDEQLNPNSIYDAKAENKLPTIPSDIDDIYDDDLIRRWYIRMEWTRKLLQEKMTWIWHEHFSTSMEEVDKAALMLDHEELLRRHSLGNFRDFLIDMTKDQAMLFWLDNNRNNAKDSNCADSEVPIPNENYAREFLQLFTTGEHLLNIDGTPVLDNNGLQVPAYAEEDIDQIALALTGWYVPYPRERNNSKFGCVEGEPCYHNACDKAFFLNDPEGPVLIPGQSGAAGASETTWVIDAVLGRRTVTVAAFISKMLIQKLVTETPSPEYVQAVATQFIATNWNIKEAVRTILTWSSDGTTPEILKPENMRSMHKEPVEYLIGAIRAFNAKIKDVKDNYYDDTIDWTYDMGQLAYWPPSVFSFYPPGNRGALVDTSYVFIRDRVADEYVRGYSDTFFAPEKLIGKFNLTTPEAAVTYLEERMLAYPISEPTRTYLLTYMEGRVDPVKLRGLIWLVMTSPDYQRN